MKRGPKPCLVELPLRNWMDECADQMVCPTLTEIEDEAQAMAEKKTSVLNPALSCKFGKTCLGGSSCMVKMRPKLPLHGTAKK